MSGRLDIAVEPSPNPVIGAPHSVVPLQSAQPLPDITGRTAPTPTAVTVRATTITLVLEEILTHTDYLHGRFKE